MRALIAAAMLAALAACASQQQVTLLPRGEAKQGVGTLDRINHDLVVTIEDRTYRGKSVLQTSSTTAFTAFGSRTATASSNISTALLIGDAGGQMRCEYGWDALMTSATGVCVDNRNQTYDVLIKN